MQHAAARASDHRLPADATARRLDRILRELLPGSSWQVVRRLVETGKIRVDGRPALDPAECFGAGARIEIRPSAPRADQTGALRREALVYTDTQLVVVNKPAGMSTVPYADERDTLDRQVRSLLRRTPRKDRRESALGIVQRLDKDTSGLIVLCRTRTAKQELQRQFRARRVHRRYIALVHGHCSARTLRSRLVTDRGDGLRGSIRNPALGREAVTHVRVLERFESTTLVECALETGRTHQIRIQLSESGHPLVGERVYVRNHATKLADVPAPRQMLHAAELGFVHPVSGRTLSFSEPPPADMQRVIDALRGRQPRAPK